MEELEIYEKAGIYSYHGKNYYKFNPSEHGDYIDIDVHSDVVCCDVWKHKYCDENILTFKGRKYEFRKLREMNGENILYVIIQEGGAAFNSKSKHNFPHESASITIISDKYFCKTQYCHFHNGKYPVKFSYYTTLNDDIKL